MRNHSLLINLKTKEIDIKTSIVYATIKCVVKHEDNVDPETVLSEANYEVSIEPNEGSETPNIVSTEMTEVENHGECHPEFHYLLSKLEDRNS